MTFKNGDTISIASTHSAQRGLFESNIRMNLHGNPVMKLLRHKFHIPDDNGFVTQFVIGNLLEVHTKVS